MCTGKACGKEFWNYRCTFNIKRARATEYLIHRKQKQFSIENDSVVHRRWKNSNQKPQCDCVFVIHAALIRIILYIVHRYRIHVHLIFFWNCEFNSYLTLFVFGYIFLNFPIFFFYFVHFSSSFYTCTIFRHQQYTQHVRKK